MKSFPYIQQDVLEKEYLKISGVTELKDEVDRRGVIMLACCIYGPTLRSLTRHLSYPTTEIRECLTRLRTFHILKNRKMMVEWFEKDGAIAFLCDHLVVEGLLERSDSK